MDIEKRLPVGQAVQLLRVAHVADVMCEEAPVVKKGTRGVVESWTGRDYNRLCTVRITDGEHAGKVVRVGNRIKDDEPHKAHQVGTFFKPIGPSPDSSKGRDSGWSRTLMPATIPAKGSWWRTTPDSSTTGRGRDRSRSPRTLPKLRDGTMASKAEHATPDSSTRGRGRDSSRFSPTPPKLRDGTMASSAGHVTPAADTKGREGGSSRASAPRGKSKVPLEITDRLSPSLQTLLDDDRMAAGEDEHRGVVAIFWQNTRSFLASVGLATKRPSALLAIEDDIASAIEDGAPGRGPGARQVEVAAEVERILRVSDKREILGRGSFEAQKIEFRRLALLLHPDKRPASERADLAWHLVQLSWQAAKRVC